MEKKVTFHPRKLARSMAKAQLDKSKVTGYNKERVGANGRKMPSLFARTWQNLAKQVAGMVKPKKRRRK